MITIGYKATNKDKEGRLDRLIEEIDKIVYGHNISQINDFPEEEVIIELSGQFPKAQKNKCNTLHRTVFCLDAYSENRSPGNIIRNTAQDTKNGVKEAQKGTTRSFENMVKEEGLCITPEAPLHNGLLSKKI